MLISPLYLIQVQHRNLWIEPLLQMMLKQLDLKKRNKSTHLEVFCKKGALKNFTKFTEKHLCQSRFFNKVAGPLKKRLWHRCFSMNFAKFLRLPFYRAPLDDSLNDDCFNGKPPRDYFWQNKKRNLWKF